MVRFVTEGIYKLIDGPAMDDNLPQYDCVRPAMDDNGQFVIVDCWLTDSDGNIHPEYNISPVPIHVDGIGERIQ